MSRDDIRKLLGGYATGTLTHEEEQALFEAALADQELFDALEREQSLRDLLRDRSARAELLAALDTHRPRWWSSWKRPAVAAAAIAGIAIVAVILVRTNVPTPRPVSLAVATLPERAPVAVAAEPEPKTASGEVAPALSRRADALKGSRNQSLPMGNAGGGAVKREVSPGSGGVIGGFIGGVPGGFPPPPPPPAAAAPPPPPPALKAELRPEAPVSARAAVAEQVAGSAVSPRARDLFLGSQVTVAPPFASGFVQATQPGRARQSPDAAPQQDRTQSQNGLAAAEVVPQAKARALPAGVRYAFLRRSPDGQLAAVNIEDLRAGDTVSLRLETNASGFLYAWTRSDGGAWRTLASFTVEVSRTYTTAPLEPVEKEIAVWFSQQWQPAMTAPAPPSSDPTPAANALDRVGTANYVVNPQAGSAQVRFTIRLP